MPANVTFNIRFHSKMTPLKNFLVQRNTEDLGPNIAIMLKAGKHRTITCKTTASNVR